MLAEFLIELKLNEEQDKINLAQIVTGSSGTARHSMYDEYVNASKEKVPSKGKGKEGDGKGGKSNWRAPCDEFWKPGGCSQGHHCPKVPSKETARQMCYLRLNPALYFSMQASSEAQSQECRVG